MGVTEQSILLLTQFAAALLGTWLVRGWAASGRLVDVPNERSSHINPTPRGGGLAIVLVFFVGVVYIHASGLLTPDVAIAAVCGALIAGVGLYDDITSMQARSRLLVHAAAAVCAIGFLLWGENVIPRSLAIQSLMFAGWVLALIWATNLFNFMDGIDGLAAGEAIFLGCAGTVIFHQFNLPVSYQLSTLMIAATTAGFLVLNWSPASIFMGDVGSAFLGFSLAVVGMFASYQHNLPLEVWIILSGCFFVDATTTLIVRAFLRQNPAKAHRTHAYQHLARAYGHRATVLCVTAVNLCWLLPWALAAAHFPRFSTVCLIVALTPVVLAVLYFRAGRDAAN